MTQTSSQWTNQPSHSETFLENSETHQKPKRLISTGFVGVSAVNRSGGTYVCSSDEPAVAYANFLSKMPSESSHRVTPVRDTTTR